MSEEITIRPSEQRDADSILALVTEINDLHGDPPGLFTAQSVQQDVFGEDSPIKTLVAELDEEVVGFVFYHGTYESGYAERGLYVTDICVSGSHRRKGVASALMKAVAKQADALGYTYVWWMSQKWNKGAHSLYKELGATHEKVVAHALVSDQFKKLLED